MEKFITLAAIAAPYLKPNVDTDTIIRIERCIRTPRRELGRYAFEMARFLPDGSENPEFVLNREPFRQARILVCGENFGCGSSREMAVWAIAGLGIRCVIAPSFGDVFFGNCFQNGVLPVRLPPDTVDRIGRALLEHSSEATLKIDLEQQRIVTAQGAEISFEIDPLKKKALLQGLDDIGMTIAREAEIAAWQKQDHIRRPWVRV